MDKSLLELIDSHLKKAHEKLKTAEKLLEWGGHDDSASRSYYAAFHAAQALLVSEGLDASTHSGVKMLFHLHFIKSKRIEAKYGRYLSNLKDEREEGDYDVVSSLDEDIAKNALHEAREFVKEIERILAPIIHPNP